MTDPDQDAIVPDSVLPADELDYDGSDDDFEPEADDGEVDPLAALLGGGGAGGLDFGALLEQASEMQSQLLAAQQAAAETEIEGVAGGGAVRIGLTGGFEFRSVTIDPSAVDPDDVEMLQDLVLAALRDGVERVQQLQAGSLDLGGLDLGGLLGG